MDIENFNLAMSFLINIHPIFGGFIRILSFAHRMWRSHSRCYRETRIKTVTFSTGSKTRVRAKRKGIPSAWKGKDVLNRNSSLGLRESQSQRESTSSSLIREPRSCPRHFEISSSTSPYSIEKANIESAAKTFTTHFNYCRSHTRVRITFFSYFTFFFALLSSPYYRDFCPLARDRRVIINHTLTNN